MRLDQTRLPILEALNLRGISQHAPFYTPGHKRGRGASGSLLQALGADFLKLDLPELPGLDNLFVSEGIIQEAQELAAAAFGAEQTWFLVNGSTCGVMAAILTVCNPGDLIILPRNVHQSAIAGLIHSGAQPVFITPEYAAEQDLLGSITPKAVATALSRYPQAKAVMMVYPSYEGLCGDVATIAEMVHNHGIPLLVDEAHAPHFHFHPQLPIAALSAGADLTVQSTHKVLSALTQASMLHVQGTRIDRDRLSQVLRLFQSSSPNYLLLASLDAARQQMAVQGKAILTETIRLATEVREEINRLPPLSTLNPAVTAQLPGCMALDPTRLTLRVSHLGLTGFQVDEWLDRTQGITAEFPALHYLTFIVSLGNTQVDLKRLVSGLAFLVDQQPLSAQANATSPRRQLGLKAAESDDGNSAVPALSVPALSPRQAFFAPTETVPLAQAVNRISAELVCPYPPGIPVLLPGEAIAPAALAYLQQVLVSGGMISGCQDSRLETLKVIKL